MVKSKLPSVFLNEATREQFYEFYDKSRIALEVAISLNHSKSYFLLKHLTKYGSKTAIELTIIYMEHERLEQTEANIKSTRTQVQRWLAAMTRQNILTRPKNSNCAYDVNKSVFDKMRAIVKFCETYPSVEEIRVRKKREAS